MLRVIVRSVKLIAQFRHHLRAYLYSLAYPPLLPGVSIHPLTTGIIIEYEIDWPFCLGGSLGLASDDLDTTEIILLSLLSSFMSSSDSKQNSFVHWRWLLFCLPFAKGTTKDVRELQFILRHTYGTCLAFSTLRCSSGYSTSRRLTVVPVKKQHYTQSTCSMKCDSAFIVACLRRFW